MTVTIVDDGPVRHVIIDRPDRRNAVDAATLDRLAEEIVAGDGSPDIRVIVLTGRGSVFCSGGDLDVDDPLSAASTARTADAVARCVSAITGVSTPVVAAVRGPAVGAGVSLALAADLAVVSSGAFFSLPFTTIGLMPDGGSTTVVAAAVGRATAMRMALLGERVTANEALRLGLVSTVFDDDEYETGLAAVVGALVGRSPEAVAESKAAINAATLTELPDALQRERAGQIRLTTGAGFREAIAAFNSRRSAAPGPGASTSEEPHA